MWDIIGDIHGEANKLKALLKKCGYRQLTPYHFHHPTRKVCFLGDYIDRGNQITETLEIVRSMCQNNSAVALMGNHEFNYLAYLTKRQNPIQQKISRRSVIYVRRHNRRHRSEVTLTHQTLQKLPDKGKSFIDWLYTLPIYHETPGFRAVHATWDDRAIKIFKNAPFTVNKKTISKKFIENFHNHIASREAFSLLIKGITVNLPKGVFFTDHQGEDRDYVRLAWWSSILDDKTKLSPNNLSQLLILKQHDANRIAQTLTEKHVQMIRDHLSGYPPTAKPLFIGHYWLEQDNIARFTRQLRAGTQKPYLLKPNLCCLDFSAVQGGPLVAYRFYGETALSEKNLVWVY